MPFLTCVDCLKDFRGDEFVAHTKCFTEAERYAAKGTYVAKPERNKGAQKQELWTECLEELAQRNDLEKYIRDVLQRVAAQPNVPRKKPKFVNFIKSCMRFDNTRAEKIWSIIEAGLDEFKKRTATLSNGNVNGQTKAVEANGNEPEKRDETINGEINGDAKTSSENGRTDNRLSEVFVHALNQGELDKATKKLLKKLQKSHELPLNVDSPKKKKFMKFVQNTFEVSAERSEEIWKLISASLDALNSTKNGHANGAAIKRKNDDNDNETNTSKKTKLVETEVQDIAENNPTVEFDVQANILRLFTKFAVNDEIDLTKLKTKVMKRYTKHMRDAGIDTDATSVEKKINKQLKRIDTLITSNGVVKLKA